MCLLLKILKTGSLLLWVRRQNEFVELMTISSEKITERERDRDRQRQQGTFPVYS